MRALLSCLLWPAIVEIALYVLLSKINDNDGDTWTLSLNLCLSYYNQNKPALFEMRELIWREMFGRTVTFSANIVLHH